MKRLTKKQLIRTLAYDFDRQISFIANVIETNGRGEITKRLQGLYNIITAENGRERIHMASFAMDIVLDNKVIRQVELEQYA